MAETFSEYRLHTFLQSMLWRYRMGSYGMNGNHIWWLQTCRFLYGFTVLGTKMFVVMRRQAVWFQVQQLPGHWRWADHVYITVSSIHYCEQQRTIRWEMIIIDIEVAPQSWLFKWENEYVGGRREDGRTWRMTSTKGVISIHTIWHLHWVSVHLWSFLGAITLIFITITNFIDDNL